MSAAAAAIAFSGQPLDRADHVRTDPVRLAEARGNGLLLRLDGLVREEDEGDRLGWAPMPADLDGAELVFLGLRESGHAAFARVPPSGDPDPAYTRRRTWQALGRLRADDLAIYGGARSLLDWHARHRFCANCGGGTVPAKGGWQRNCPSCEAQHFPRVDPVAIMLAECDGKLLLGRQRSFPERSYSALAGFVEPGETAEEAVARETYEEAGVRIRDIRYIASQPWPFPSQLMLGFIGRADSLALRIDETEIEDARWFTREQVAEAEALGQDSAGFVPPPERAIARHLIRWWLEQTR